MIRPLSETSPTVERLMAIFRERMHLDGVLPDTHLFESGTIDSLGFVNLLVHLEEVFGFQVNMAELELDDFHSIVRIAAVVDAHLAASAKGLAETNGQATHVS